jgi:sterol 3beta-glucosyltransferase
MKVLINTIGTRGDIQPFVALAQGLQRAGHAPTICTAEGFRSFIEEHGIAYAHMDNRFYELMQTPEGKAILDGGGNAFSIYKQVEPMIRSAMDDEWAAAQAIQPDLLLFHPKALGGYHIAERLNLPVAMALPLPMYTPTRAYPMPLFTGNLPLGGWFNRLSYSVMRLANVMYANVINDFRTKTLGLQRISRFANPLRKWDGEPLPILYPYSRHVLPVPADYPPHVHVTGYWFLAEKPGWQPPGDLLHFLEAGPPPIYVGFGSMSGSKGKERAQIIIDALQQTGQRGVLVSGWGGLNLNNVPDSILLLENVPHDWLFPRMSMVVHHGGAGTTAAGLRAGKPTIICPFIADQPFWGKIVYELGAGPKPIPQNQLTAEKLAAAITEASTDREMQQRAALLGEQIRSEDGIGNAIAVLEALVDSPATTRTGEL